MKTCEEYVINELIIVKEKNQELEEKYKILKDCEVFLMEVVFTLQKYMKSSDDKVISMDCVFKEYHPKDFELLQDMLSIPEDYDE